MTTNLQRGKPLIMLTKNLFGTELNNQKRVSLHLAKMTKVTSPRTMITRVTMISFGTAGNRTRTETESLRANFPPKILTTVTTAVP